MKKTEYAVRNIRLCTKDCLCLYVCPTGATDTENSIIDVDKCIGCGACANACPSKAISMVPLEMPPQQPKESAVVAALNDMVASKVKVEQAARQAYIYDQIVALPGGFEANALQLSGGQQQRIAIARMFLKNPPIIFLDEPTASLDAIATEHIKASIDAIKQGRTVIVISHNIGQIIDSDAL